MQAITFEIYQIAPSPPLWEIPHMVANQDKRTRAAARAKALHERLMAVKPRDLSNNEWARRADVNTSIFTALKNGSEPSVGIVRALLEAIGLSLPEFFLYEAKGRVAPKPNEQAVEKAIRDALPGLPKAQGRQVQYLAAVVADVLALPPEQTANPANEDERKEPDPATRAPSRAPTKRAGSSR